MIGQTVLHYKILARLGSGGMGDVYLALDTKLQRRVALKFLPADQAADPDARHRFIHEAKAQALISHPNIAAFHDVQEHESHAFIVMEYVEGRPLSLVAQADKPSLSEILEYTIQVGEGLQAAHEKGVVHRDVKPQNVVVTAKGHVKILDFGLARWRDATSITKTGTQMGTASYMSPEQAESRKVDHRSDIFSLGVMLYELVCACRPFEGESEPAVLYEILHTEPEPLSRFSRAAPDELQRIVSKCLAKRVEERYQSSSDLVADLRRLKRDLESGVTSGTSVSSVVRRRRWLPYALTGTGVLAIALILVLTNPFKWKVVEDPGAIAAENSLAVMYFDNLADPADTSRSSDILTSLLITDLSESEFLRVVSRERLFDILSQLGQGDSRSIDRKTASQVAARAGARYVVSGDILQLSPTIIVASTVYEAQSGVNVSAKRVVGEPGQDMFQMVDRLSATIKGDLDLPAKALKKTYASVANVTTHSQAAYRHYLEGRDYSIRGYAKQAAECYKAAIQCDSTFAMAYLRLSQLDMYVPVDERPVLLAKIKQYAHLASWREQRFIEAREALMANASGTAVDILRGVLKRFPEDKEMYQQLASIYGGSLNPDWDSAFAAAYTAIRLDSNYRPTWFWLAQSYVYNAVYDSALWAVNRYLSLAPNEAVAYALRAEVCAYIGPHDEAVLSYQKAIELNPDGWGMRLDLGWVYLWGSHDYVEAEKQFRLLASTFAEAEIRAAGRQALADIPSSRGQFTRALELLDDGLAADRMEGLRGWYPSWKHVVKLRIFTELGDFAAARRELSLANQAWWEEDPADTLGWIMFEPEIEARDGNFTRAESLLSILRTLYDASDWERAAYWMAAGNVMEARGNIRAAIAYYDSSHSATVLRWKFQPRFLLARALLNAGELGEAARLFEKLLLTADQSSIIHPFWISQVHYYLGRTYEASGWKQQAIQQYDEFLDIWSVADSGLAIVDDAKQRLAALKS